MSVKPRMPATTDTRKKISAHFRIVIAQSSSERAAGLGGAVEVGDLTSGDGAGSGNR
jgi:hypothetical protein